MKRFISIVIILLLTTPLVSLAKPKARGPVVLPTNAAALKKAIAARKGKVVLVNFWATWCPPCVEEFPGLVKLQKNYGAKGLSVLFVSADELKTQKTKVEPFLKKNSVTTPTWIVQDNPFTFIPQFDPTIEGAFGLPRTYVYNRQGKLVKVFSEDKSYKEFEKLIKPLL